ncbi:MAG: transposase [Desulfomonile tiedjei]|uniref:Transposase n=1 Tax=Desulfomonile tiedjei TaxID=2358 RepID=A0A9D6Z6C7_9BACT|nr:transposase [Desulfomonile tiedjei]
MTLRWDKTSCHRFAANQARLLMGVLACNLLQMLRQFYLMGEEVKRSMEWLIKRLVKVGENLLPRKEVVCSCGVCVSLG